MQGSPGVWGRWSPSFGPEPYAVGAGGHPPLPGTSAGAMCPNSGGTTDKLFALSRKAQGVLFEKKEENTMSFVSVDFYGARQMAGEMEGMAGECTAMAQKTGVTDLETIAEELKAMAADVRRACDAREKLDNGILDSMRPDYKEVLK